MKSYSYAASGKDSLKTSFSHHPIAQYGSKSAIHSTVFEVLKRSVQLRGYDFHRSMVSTTKAHTASESLLSAARLSHIPGGCARVLLHVPKANVGPLRRASPSSGGPKVQNQPNQR